MLQKDVVRQRVNRQRRTPERDGAAGRAAGMPPYRAEQVEGSKSIGAFVVLQGGRLNSKKKNQPNPLSACHLEVKVISFQVLAPVSLCSCNIKKNLALNPQI